MLHGNTDHGMLLLTLLLFSLRKSIQVHVMTKGMIHLGMMLAKWKLPVKFVDFILVSLANIRFGNLSKYGIVRPNMGPLLLKAKTGRSAVIDVGTTELIKKGVIKVSTVS